MVGPSTGSSSYSRTFEYSRDMNTTCKVQFILRYETADETIQTIKKDVSVTLENYSQEYYDRYLPEKVLQRVTTGYKGNYTLK